MNDFDDFMEFEDTGPEEHLAELGTVLPYIWINEKGNTVDIRKMPYLYILNLRKWMEKHHTKNTPYKDTPQYVNVVRANERYTKRLQSALKALTAK